MNGMTRWMSAVLGMVAVAGGVVANDVQPVSPPAPPETAVPAGESAKPAAAPRPGEAGVAPAAEPAAVPTLVPAATPDSATPVASTSAPVKTAPKPAQAAGSTIKGTVPVGNASPADYPDLAKVQLQYAIRAAMTKVQGKLLKVELEPTGGFLVWEVEIVKSDKSIFAVKVDAGSGAVLLVEQDEPGSDPASNGHRTRSSDE